MKILPFNQKLHLNHNRKAFTLVEVLVGIAVIGIFVVIAIEMFSTVARVGETGTNTSIALNLAQEKMEQIKNLVRKGTLLNVGSGSNSEDSFLPDLDDVSTEAYLNGSLYLTDSNTYRADSSPDTIAPRTDIITQITWEAGVNSYKKVQVSVFWEERGNTKWIGLVSLIRE